MVRGDPLRVATWLALVGLLWSGSAAAEEVADPALVAHVFERLGVRHEIAAIAPAASARLVALPGASEVDRRTLERIVRRGFAPDRILRAAQHDFLDRLDLERTRRAARGLDRPAAQRRRAGTRDERAARRAALVVRAMFDAAGPLLPPAVRTGWRLPTPHAPAPAGDEAGWLDAAVAQAVELALQQAARRTAHDLIEHFAGRGPRAPVRMAGTFGSRSAG
ncbi:MAG: hypothetical protein ACQGVC_02050 [Myxococcota bacterium]